MASEKLPLGRPLAAVDLLPFLAPPRNAPILLVGIPSSVPPQAFAVGEVGVRERAADVLAERAPRSLDGAVATWFVRRARRYVHTPALAHLLVLSFDEVRRVVAVQVPDGIHAHVAHPREEQVRAFGRLGAALRLLEVEAVDARAVVMVPADDPLAAVDMPHAHFPVVEGHGVVRVELHARRTCQRRVGGALGQVLEHVGTARVERVVHRLCVELGRAALAARHCWHARCVHVGQDGHPNVDKGDVVARVARAYPEAEAILSAESAHADQRVRAVLHDERARSHEVVHGAVAPPTWNSVGHVLGRHHRAVGGRHGDGVRPPCSGHGVPPILLDRAVGGVDGRPGVEQVETWCAYAAGLEGRRLLRRIKLVDVHLDPLESEERRDAQVARKSNRVVALQVVACPLEGEVVLLLGDLHRHRAHRRRHLDHDVSSARNLDLGHLAIRPPHEEEHDDDYGTCANSRHHNADLRRQLVEPAHEASAYARLRRNDPPWRMSIMMVIMAVVAAKMAPASVDLAQSSSEWVTSPV
eukprot:scaffold88325_cov108-Phaeocystis_antarctica.AAC.2